MNIGDDAFIEVAAWGAKKYWGKSNNIFLANKDKLPQTLYKARGYPFVMPKSYRLQGRVLLPYANYFISAGGSTIHREIKKSDIKYLAMQRRSKGLGLKIGGIGVSIGPFNT